MRCGGETYKKIKKWKRKKNNNGPEQRGGMGRNKSQGRVLLLSPLSAASAVGNVMNIRRVQSQNPPCCCEKKSFHSEPWGCWEEPSAPTSCEKRGALRSRTSGISFQRKSVACALTTYLSYSRLIIKLWITSSFNNFFIHTTKGICPHLALILSIFAFNTEIRGWSVYPSPQRLAFKYCFKETFSYKFDFRRSCADCYIPPVFSLTIWNFILKDPLFLCRVNLCTCVKIDTPVSCSLYRSWHLMNIHLTVERELLRNELNFIWNIFHRKF